MGDNSYSQATTITYDPSGHGTVNAQLDPVENTVTSHHHLEAPVPEPDPVLPAIWVPAPPVLRQHYPPFSSTKPYITTDRAQRAATVTRSPGVILAGRPQQRPAMCADQRSYVNHFPLGITGLDTALTAIDLGADWRFFPQANTFHTWPFLLGGYYGVAGGWLPGQGTGDLVNVELEMVDISAALSGATPNQSVVNDFAYFSRLGEIIRPIVDSQQCITTLKRSISYAGSNPLVTEQFITTFTVALVVSMGAAQWGFVDLAATYRSVLDPGKATSATLRMVAGDRLQVYGHSQRCFDELISQRAEGNRLPPHMYSKRPIILVWSMNSAGTGSLAVITPKKRISRDLVFQKAGGPFQLTSPAYNLGYSTQPVGAADPYGGLTFGASNFEHLYYGSLTNSGYAGSSPNWGIHDIGIWSAALDTGECEAVANQLDNVYGVSA